MAHDIYCCSQAILDSIGSLIDGGASGGLTGTDICLLEYTEQCADITVVDQASLNKLPLLTCPSTVNTTHRPIVFIMYQYAYYEKGSTINSAGQLSYFGC